MLALFFFTLGIFGVAMLVMAVGVIFSGRCLRGSCGGPDILDGDGESLRCASCPKRKEAEARRRAGLPVVG